jgi:hypothetical protein
MLPLAKTLITLCSVLLIVACQPPEPSAKGPLEGAWKGVESSFTWPDTSWTNTSPQPSLLLFTGHYYSEMFVTAGRLQYGNMPRALFKDKFRPTDSERLAAFNSFIANCGTYQMTDSTITTSPIVARNPNFMAGEWFHTFVYRVQSDSLWLTLTSPAWAPEGKFRWTLVRLE